MSIPLDIAPLKIVENSNPPGMEVLSFGVKLPSEMFRRHPEGPEASNVGVVGTITLFAQKSAMIWFGFGSLTTSRDEKDANVGSATTLSMGPLMVAMPRSKYQGAFSSGEAATSKLVGDEAEDSELLASQMASRLSQRLGVPVFVSCSFANAPNAGAGGGGGNIEAGLLQQRAAALAEKEVWRILETKLGTKK